MHHLFTNFIFYVNDDYFLCFTLCKQVAEALLEITLPRFSGDVVPETDAGIVLAVADR